MAQLEETCLSGNERYAKEPLFNSGNILPPVDNCRQEEIDTSPLKVDGN